MVDLNSGEGHQLRMRRTPTSRVLETCTGLWEFDVGRRRFRHVPAEAAHAVAAVDAAWQPYARLELDATGPGFTVVLNPAGTRLLRACRHTGPCPDCGAR